MGVTWRDRELLHLVVQPTAKTRRPCPACAEECPRHRDPTCTCECGPACPLAGERVAPAVGHVPQATLPIVWELACLRVVEVLRADDRASIGFRTGSVALPALLATRIEELSALGTLRGRWRLGVSSGAGPTYELAPDDRDAADASADLDALGRGLSIWVRERAQSQLVHAGLDELTPRERVVLLGLLDGASVRMLARRLFVSRHTVRNQLKAVFRKLGVHSQDELRERFVGRTQSFEIAEGRERRPSVAPGN